MADYPRGKTAKLPSGSMSCTFVGSKTVTTRRQGAKKEMDASKYADSMTAIVPGAAAGPTTWERD